MSLSRAAIVDQLKEIVGADRVITDETVLKKNSIDRFRKFPDIHGIYTLPIPAAVVKLGSTEQVSRVLNFMNAHKINGVPRTGASATEGGLETVVENSVVLDGSAMNQIINIDIENMQATAQCGVPLEVLENALREKGYTTGHSPQSKPLAQMGGLVATRSIGQFSTLYGAIEDMVVGLEAVLADEDWDYVSLQQASPFSGMYETYEASLPELIEYVKARLPKKTKLMLHQTWAYASTSKHSGFKNYNCNQLTMYQAIADAVKKAAKANKIKIVIPSGTAIQNARTSFIGDHLNRDGYHLDVKIGRYTAACTWFERIFKHSVVGNPYVPEGLDEARKTVAQKAAHAAVKHPYKVTELSITN